jgi:hypothetical protein
MEHRDVAEHILVINLDRKLRKDRKTEQSLVSGEPVFYTSY